MVDKIDAKTTRRMVRSDDALPIDVLGPESYKRRHLLEAINIPVDDPHFKDEVRGHVPKKDDKLIVYREDRKCQETMKAASRLEMLGYEHVYEFEGGLEEWHEKGFPFSGGGMERRPLETSWA